MSPAVFLSAYDENDVKPGWIALILVILLGVATVLLWRSMNTQLRKINVPTREELRTSGTTATTTDPSAVLPPAPDQGRGDADTDRSDGEDRHDPPDPPAP